MVKHVKYIDEVNNTYSHLHGVRHHDLIKACLQLGISEKAVSFFFFFK